MLRSFSTNLRLSLALVLGCAAGIYPVLHTSPAWADDDDEEEDDDDEDEDKKKDDDEESEDEEDEEEVDPDQPLVTAGGLYTIATYPQGEIQRPLTITQGITELRAGIGFDISNKTAFESFGLSLDGRYGMQDNVELQAGFSGIKNFDVMSAYAAFEGSIIYDLVDFRTGFSIDIDPSTTRVGIPIGFPFRYAPKEQVAVTALETAFQIQFDGKPDATPSVGIVVQPAPIVAILVKASLVIPEFDFTAANIKIPAAIAVQLSPNNKIDAGMEFRFGNLKLPEGTDIDGDGMPDKFYDDRFLLFFGQIRL
jgi:hypothetical protein